jgi:polysaccharide biosynthesis protein PelC
MMNKNIFRAMFILFFLANVMISGCSKPSIYIHPTPGFNKIKKIAIMPFNNLTTDDKAGEKVRNSFVVELLRTGSFGVLDTGETDRILRSAGYLYNEIQDLQTPKSEDDKISIPLSKKIGDTLHVQAVLAGSVEEYSIKRVDDQEIPEVSVSVRLLDAETGIIIWASTYTKRGSSGIPILGWGKATSLSRLSNQLAQDMASSLAKNAH